jgi:hypothetical protein
VYVAAAPVLVPRGLSQWTIEIVVGGTVGTIWMLDVFDTAGAKTIDGAVGDGFVYEYAGGLRYVGEGQQTYRWPVSLAAGLYYLGVRTEIASEESLQLLGLSMIPTGAGAAVVQSLESEDDRFPTDVPGAAMSVVQETVHDEMLTPQSAVSGWVLTKLNRNINNLFQFITGAPVRGNATLTVADSSSIDPAWSRFSANTRRGPQLSAEPLVQFPLFTSLLGCVRESSQWCVSRPTVTDGIIGWHAPFPIQAAAAVPIHHVRCWVPNFPSSPSNLKIHVLAINELGKGTPTAWQVRVAVSFNGGVVFTSGLVSFTRLGTTRFHVATVSAVSFQSDEPNTFSVEIERSSNVVVNGEIAILGVHAVFDP